MAIEKVKKVMILSEVEKKEEVLDTLFENDFFMSRAYEKSFCKI